MKTTLLILQLFIISTLLGQNDTSKIWTGDVITFKNSESKRVNILKWKNSSVTYTNYGDDMHVLHKIDRSEVKDVKWDGVVQIKKLGYYQNYQVINNTEDKVHRSLQNGKHLLLAGFINGAVGIISGVCAIEGYIDDDIGFGIAIFGSRSWLPLIAAGGSNLNKTRKRSLIQIDE